MFNLYQTQMISCPQRAANKHVFAKLGASQKINVVVANILPISNMYSQGMTGHTKCTA